VKYECPITNHSRDMANVKVSVALDKQTDGQTDGQSTNYMSLNNALMGRFFDTEA
jgi:hypothetical protein